MIECLTFNQGWALGKGKRDAHGKKILVARVFSLQRQALYQIKA